MNKTVIAKVTLLDGRQVLMGMRTLDHYRATMDLVYSGTHERYNLVTHNYRQVLDTETDN